MQYQITDVYETRAGISAVLSCDDEDGTERTLLFKPSLWLEERLQVGHGVKALHHAAWQEGGDHVGLEHLAPMVHQVGHGITVHDILPCGISHHVEPPLAGAVPGNKALGLCNGPGLQLADKVRVGLAELVKLKGEPGALRAQGPARGGHADPPELRLGLLLKPPYDLPGHRGHLFDLNYLAVKHGSAVMLLLLNGRHTEPAPLLPAQHTDNAAGADVQGKYRAGLLLFHHEPHLSKGNRTAQ